MSRSYTFNTPAKGAANWDIPLNENFKRIAAQLELLYWRLSDLDGYAFHHRVGGHFDFEIPSRGDSDWHLPLNENFETIAAFAQEIDEKVSQRDGGTPADYDYQTPEKGAPDWHLPLNENFDRIAADLEALDDRISSLEESSSSYVATIDSGTWNDPAVWDTGEVPQDGENVLIRKGTSITLSGATAALDWVRVEGELTFDPTVDTHLAADSVLTTMGSSFVMGSETAPIQQGVEARVTFRDTGPINETLDPGRRSRGLMVHGVLNIHGAEKTAWTTLSSFPSAGDTSISLSASPTNWQPGDRIVIPGVVPNDNQDEERIIESVNGSTVHLNSPLEHDHAPPKSDLDSYVLNLTRNVVFESESTDELRRGHLMVMMSTGTDVRYARFDELGRTNKARYITNPVRGAEHLPDGMDPNPAARYPLHWHRTGADAEDPHLVEGVVVDGAPGWGIVNHHAHAHVTDSITYNVLGSGFVAEGGNERGSFKRNFALRSEGSGETLDSRSAGVHGGDPPIDDFGHAGHGFWLHSPLVEMVDNVAAGHRLHGIALWLRPLLDAIHMTLAECDIVEDSRVTFCPNVPMEWLEGQEPMLEAIEQGRFSSDSEDALMWDTQKVPSTFVKIKRFEGNEVFACGAGLELSRHNFKWKHERFEDFSVIEDLTVYNIGTFIDDDGEEHSPDLPKHLASGHQGRGGNVGVSLRYLSNVTLKNCRIIGTGRKNSIGVPFHDYRWTTTIENCTIENWDWGIATGEHRLNWIRGCTFRDNNYDVDWSFDNAGPAILENNDLNRVRHKFEYINDKATEVLTFGQKRGLSIDGRAAHVEHSAPDFVPFPDEDALGGVNNIEDIDTVGDETDLIGLTNAEMLEAYGICISGRLMPDDAVGESYLEGSLLDPEGARAPPTNVKIDATTGTIGDGFEIVSEPEATDGRCLRATGATNDPPSDSGATYTFECAAGTYHLYFRAWPDSWNGDTFYHRVDGGSWIASPKKEPPSSFEWHSASERNGPNHDIELGEGEHTLEIAIPNDDVLVDSVWLVSDGTVIGGK